MHEHISNHLPDPEIRTIKVMYTQNLGHHRPTKHHAGNVKNHIDDQQVLDYWRDICKWGKPFVHLVVCLYYFSNL